MKRFQILQDTKLIFESDDGAYALSTYQLCSSRGSPHTIELIDCLRLVTLQENQPLENK